jgi:REP element-mobilizing transposase RayT
MRHGHQWGHPAPMTCARKHFAPRGLPGRYHCIARCVRRAWLCGDDPYSGKNFDHRRQWVEDRINFLAELFAVSIMSFAVMSNHLHVVLELRPDAVDKWAAEDIADRWIRLFPSAREGRDEQRREILLSDPEALAERRLRLCDLSWFMRCLDEHIARKANDEDDVTGRFWEGRFKCQVLESEQALAAAMVYVDLNPVRAGIADGVLDSRHTSVKQRAEDIKAGRVDPNGSLKPIAGIGQSVLALTNAQYIELVDWSGRQMYPGKRGKIEASEPRALARFGIASQRWEHDVKGVGNGYWRVVGTAQELIDKAIALDQQWLKGIGYARSLVAKAD